MDRASVNLQYQQTCDSIASRSNNEMQSWKQQSHIHFSQFIFYHFSLCKYILVFA